MRYWESTKLASQVRRPVVPDSIVVRDSRRVAVRYEETLSGFVGWGFQ
jgi:hypothetical protein